MQVGFIGTGSVVETAYLPAIRRLARRDVVCYGFDPLPRSISDEPVMVDSLEQLLKRPLNLIFITTPSLLHLPVLEKVLAQCELPVIVEKPLVATLEQFDRLQRLLDNPKIASRVLALDHWMIRSDAARFIGHAEEIERIEGFLLEPGAFNAAGEPVALNFATGEADTRQFRHPDGVIVDIGTHVLAMIRETIIRSGGNDALNVALKYAKDRFGQPIQRGDFSTAEGEALLEGTVSGIPFTLHLNKYAGPNGGRKGMTIYLRSGQVIKVDSLGVKETLSVNGKIMLNLSGPLYDRCLAGMLFGGQTLFEREPQNVPQLTLRRLAEVRALLTLQQQLRGIH